jgi:hypothetical protein
MENKSSIPPSDGIHLSSRGARVGKSQVISRKVETTKKNFIQICHSSREERRERVVRDEQKFDTINQFFSLSRSIFFLVSIFSATFKSQSFSVAVKLDKFITRFLKKKISEDFEHFPLSTSVWCLRVFVFSSGFRRYE